MRFPYGRCARSLVAVFTNDAQSMRCHRIVSGSFSTQTEQRRLGFCQPWKRLSGRLIFFKLRLELDEISRIFRAVETNCRCWKSPYVSSQSKRWHDNYSSNISLGPSSPASMSSSAVSERGPKAGWLSKSPAARSSLRPGRSRALSRPK